MPVAARVAGMIGHRAVGRNPVMGPKERFDRADNSRLGQVGRERLIVVDNPRQRLHPRGPYAVSLGAHGRSIFFRRCPGCPQTGGQALAHRPYCSGGNYPLDDAVALDFEMRENFLGGLHCLPIHVRVCCGEGAIAPVQKL